MSRPSLRPTSAVNQQHPVDFSATFSDEYFSSLSSSPQIYPSIHSHDVISGGNEKVIRRRLPALFGLIIQKDVSFVCWNKIRLLEPMNPRRRLLLTPSLFDRCDGTVFFFRAGHCSCRGTGGLSCPHTENWTQVQKQDPDSTGSPPDYAHPAFLQLSPVKPKGQAAVTDWISVWPWSAAHWEKSSTHWSPPPHPTCPSSSSTGLYYFN